MSKSQVSLLLLGHNVCAVIYELFLSDIVLKHYWWKASMSRLPDPASAMFVEGLQGNLKYIRLCFLI